MMNKVKIMLLVGMMLSLIAGCGNNNIDKNSQVDTEIGSEQESDNVLEDTEVESEGLESDTEDVEASKPEGDIQNPVENNQDKNEIQSGMIEKPLWTVLNISKTMYAKSSVNVRTGPGTNYDQLGKLSTNQEVKVTGKCNEYDWYRIEYNGSEGYVSAQYLVSEKVTTGNTGTQKPKYSGYVQAAIDAGYYNVARYDNGNGDSGYTVMTHIKENKNNNLARAIMDEFLAQKGLIVQPSFGGLLTNGGEDMWFCVASDVNIREMTADEKEKHNNPELRYPLFHVSDDGVKYYDNIAANGDVLYFETRTLPNGKKIVVEIRPDWFKDTDGNAYFIKENGSKVYPGFKYPFEY